MLDRIGTTDTNGNRRPTDRVVAVILTGPVGAGKTTTMWALGDLLATSHIPHAVLDVDQVRTFHPNPPGDRFGSRLGRRNVAAVAANYLEEGARILVLADVIEHSGDRDGYVRMIPDADVSVVRLNVPMPALLARLDLRELPATIAWHRLRAPELQGIMERAHVGDLVIDVGGRTPPQIAAEIAHRLALLRSLVKPSS